MEAEAKETEDLRDQYICISCEGGPRIGRKGGKKMSRRMRTGFCEGKSLVTFEKASVKVWAECRFKQVNGYEASRNVYLFFETDQREECK